MKYKTLDSYEAALKEYNETLVEAMNLKLPASQIDEIIAQKPKFDAASRDGLLLALAGLAAGLLVVIIVMIIKA